MGIAVEETAAASEASPRSCGWFEPRLASLVAESLERTQTGDGRMAHLDGLRAVALIGVLLFHFGVTGAAGGFLGGMHGAAPLRGRCVHTCDAKADPARAVDMFFVLSGFLMSRTVLLQKQQNRFSFHQFMQARALRICPALFATIMVTMVASVVVFPKPLLGRVCESSAAAATFMSNVKFMLEGGYHDVASARKPLLHTWSLGVEGQFYTLWSLLALLFPSAGSALVPMAGLCVCSIALQVLAREHTAFLFFSMPSRLYEFGAGAVALLLYDSVSPAVSSAWHAVGASSILASFLFARADHGLPISLTSLPAVLGTVLIVAAPRGFLSKHLSAPAPRYIGMVSYSAYLVHWPVIVLCSTRDVKHPVLLEVVVTAVLSHFLFYLVENEFRVRRGDKSRATLGVLFCLLLVFCIFSYALATTVGARIVMRRAAHAGARQHSGIALLSSHEYGAELDALEKALQREGVIVGGGKTNTSHSLVLGGAWTNGRHRVPQSLCGSAFGADSTCPPTCVTIQTVTPATSCQP
jgi:peptidoglycan/LPS O-acetylase OafA/YrhL